MSSRRSFGPWRQLTARKRAGTNRPLEHPEPHAALCFLVISLLLVAKLDQAIDLLGRSGNSSVGCGIPAAPAGIAQSACGLCRGDSCVRGTTLLLQGTN